MPDQNNTLSSPEKNLKPASSPESASPENSQEVQSLQSSVSEASSEVISSTPSETPSETPSASSAQSTPTQNDPQTQKIIKINQYLDTLSEEQIRSQLSRHYRHQIKKLERKVLLLRFTPFSAHRLNTIFSRIRSLKQKLHSLAHLVLKSLKEAYRRVLLGQE